jgi:hypothetical protein
LPRPRASAYADGATRGASDAIQIADRWHLMHHLTDAVYKVVLTSSLSVDPSLIL